MIVLSFNEPEDCEGKQMFNKVILVAVALLLAPTSDDCFAAPKKKKLKPIDPLASTRGTGPTLQSNAQRWGNHARFAPSRVVISRHAFLLGPIKRQLVAA